MVKQYTVRLKFRMCFWKSHLATETTGCFRYGLAIGVFCIFTSKNDLEWVFDILAACIRNNLYKNNNLEWLYRHVLNHLISKICQALSRNWVLLYNFIKT